MPTYMHSKSVIQQLADGEVPAEVALPLFGATGFAFSKPGGGIRPVACGVALRRLAFRTIVRASTDSLQTDLGATQFGVSPGGGDDPPHPMWHAWCRLLATATGSAFGVSPPLPGTFQR